MNKDYIATEYRKMHKSGSFSGASLKPHLPEIERLIKKYDVKTLLDYGCGKASLYKKRSIACAVTLYDPYYEPYSQKPVDGFDMVVCTDVLEHIPPEEVGQVMQELLIYTNKILFLSIATYPASKKFSNGENLHLTIRPKQEWEKMINYMLLFKPIEVIRCYT